MVNDLDLLAGEHELSQLVYKKEWSNFSQFIAHTLRQVGQVKSLTKLSWFCVAPSAIKYCEKRKASACKQAAELFVNMQLELPRTWEQK
jgi:hypothetical protein